MSQDPEMSRLAELERRLAAAEAARSTDRTQRDRVAGGSQKGVGPGMRVITELLGGLVGGAVIGWFIDRLLGTEPWGLLTFLALGIAAAFRNVWKLASQPTAPPGADGGGKG